MKTFSTLIIITCLLLPQTSSAATSLAKKKQMIRESIASYSGSCPCPYSRARNGSSCGKRSAWSKPGGASPLCYVTDIR
jgi:hypothetical protein